MTIKTKCPNPDCAKQLTLGDDLAGKRIRCNECQQVLRVPDADSKPQSVSSTREQRTREQRKRSPAPAGRPKRSKQSRRPARRIPDDHFDEDEDDYDEHDEYDDHEDGFESLPARSRKPGGGGSWKKVGVGLLVTMIGTCILGGGLVLLGLSQAFAQMGMMMLISATESRLDRGSVPSIRDRDAWQAAMEERREQMERIQSRGRSARSMVEGAGTIRKVSRIVTMIGAVVCIAGFILLLFTPNQNGALAFAIAALSLGAVNVTLRLIFQVIPEFDTIQQSYDLSFLALFAGSRSDMSDKVLSLLFDVCILAESMMIAFFMISVARTKKRRDLEKSSFLLVWLLCGVLGTYVFVYIFVFVDWDLTGSRWPLYLVWFLHWGALVFTGVVTFLLIKGLHTTRKRVA